MALREERVEEGLVHGGGRSLVRPGERGTRDRLETQVVPAPLLDAERRLDVPERVLAGRLCVEEDGELIFRREALHVAVGTMLSHKRLEGPEREKMLELLENGRRVWHGSEGCGWELALTP